MPPDVSGPSGPTRLTRVRERMVETGTHALLLSVGADLPWLTGYRAMPLERLTMLVLTDTRCDLIIPGLEAARVPDSAPVDVVAWDETADPISLVVDRLDGARRVAVDDRTWTSFTLGLQAAADPGLSWGPASHVTAPLRRVKEPAELDTLRAAGAAADRVAVRLQAGEIELVGRSEASVSAELGRQLVAEGHHEVNFAIVAAGPNAASPHHEPGERVIEADEVVLCDFGGTMLGPDGVGYCSDITRCVWTGRAPQEFSELYDVLRLAQQSGVDAATVGAPCEDVDRAARSHIEAAGYGEYFMHRTGHGIGVEAHEHPYLVEGNQAPLEAGNAFSVEPGIYVPGRWGARLEDIVLATPAGPERVNRVSHALAELG